MKLHILFGQRAQRYEGEHAPEALECWDEYCIEDNEEAFEVACARRIKKCGGEAAFTSTRVVIVNVDQDKIVELLGSPTISGTIET